MLPAAECLSTPASVKELISRWGKLSEFCSDIGCGYQAGRKMRDRESISNDHWENVIIAAEKKGIPGINWEWLGRAHSNK